MVCNFSYSHYDEIMKMIKEYGYNPIFFHEEEKRKSIIVRHDLDQDMDSAIELARIENKNNIKATYFLWLNSPFYNIFEVRYRNIINEMLVLGHEIGLHFDETAYSIDSLEQMKEHIIKECNIINEYFNIKIKAVSFHRPSKYVLDGDIKVDGLVNTYAQRYFREFKYISDSRGIWKEGCLCKLLQKNSNDKIQVLAHAIWWGEKSNTNQERLHNFLDYKLNKMNRDLSNNISIYEFKDFKIQER